MADEVKIHLKGDDANLKSVLGRSENTVKGFGSSVKKVFAAIAVAVAAKKIFDFGKKLLSLYAVQEKAEARMAAVVKATGGAAGFTTQQMKDMAKALQDVTTFGDETILGAQAIIATFKNIRGDNFKRTTQAAADMASVMQTDLKGSAMQVAKALQDPLRGLTMLTRVGVTFTEQQKEMVKGFMETGDVMKAQGVILDELEGQFGGASKAMAETFTGRWEQMKNTIGDVGEQLATAFIPILEEMIPIIEKVGAFVVNLVPIFLKMTQTAIGWAKSLVTFLKPAFDFLVEAGIYAFTALQVAIENWRDTAKIYITSFQLAYVKAFNSLVHWLTQVIPDALQWFGRNWAKIFQDLANLQITIYANMLRNAAEFVRGWYAILSGEANEFKWVGLTEGFESALEELPKIAERKKGRLEKVLERELGSLQTKMGDKIGERLEENRNKFFDMFEKKAAPKLDDIVGAPSLDFDVSQKEKKEKDKKKKELKDAKEASSSFEDLVSLNKRITAAAMGIKQPEDKIEAAIKQIGKDQVDAINASDEATKNQMSFIEIIPKAVGDAIAANDQFWSQFEFTPEPKAPVDFGGGATDPSQWKVSFDKTEGTQKKQLTQQEEQTKVLKLNLAESKKIVKLNFGGLRP
jgi:hypothetical protein